MILFVREPHAPALTGRFALHVHNNPLPGHEGRAREPAAAYDFNHARQSIWFLPRGRDALQCWRGRHPGRVRQRRHFAFVTLEGGAEAVPPCHTALEAVDVSGLP
jgi:hypothetical protein